MLEVVVYIIIVVPFAYKNYMKIKEFNKFDVYLNSY